MARIIRNKRLHNFLVIFLVLVLFVIALFWARALSNIETHVDGVLACFPEDNQRMMAIELVPSADGSRAADYLVDLAERMQAAGDADTRVVAEAAFAPHNPRLDRFQSLANDYPDNSLAALHLLKICLDNMEAPGCEPHVVSNVAELEGDNAFAWGLIARYRFRQGDEYGAAASVRQAAQAPDYEDYFARQMAIIDRVIPDGVRPQANLQRMNLINFALRASLADHRYIDYCAATVSDQPYIGDACLALFEKMESDSTTILFKNLGRAGQEIVYTARGEFALAERVASSNSLLSGRSELASLPDSTGHAHTLRMFDKELHTNWVRNLGRVGEVEAWRLLAEEARSKSSDPDYRPCNPPGIRFEWPF